MMRPMKLAGDKLVFGQGCLEFLGQLEARRAMIVTGGSSMERSGILQKVRDYLTEAGAETDVFSGVEPDPSFDTVMKGAARFRAFEPDLIVALGGGSAMDAAKMMWVYYEHPELTTLEAVLPPNPFPRLRGKAKLCCIPSTSGSASEVSRSVVITDGGVKHGIGNMEMMPDVAILDPEVTATMPKGITAETGMDAMTHALEAYASTRANYLSDVLAIQAVKDIAEHLPRAYENGADLDAREGMLNASMLAGLAFTNVSLGIVHSIAHTVGSFFHVPHGLADAVILPYVIEFNARDERANGRYREAARALGAEDLANAIRSLNAALSIPASLSELVPDAEAFQAKTPQMVQWALSDGCTKTNPVIPSELEMADLIMRIYTGHIGGNAE